MKDEAQCREHENENCKLCPYYEYELEIEGSVNRGRFWVGQDMFISKGYFGDHLNLRYRGSEW